jgi:DNA-binding response OmpR family regulator
MEVFVQTPGRVFTRDDLVRRVLGEDYEGLDRTIDAHVKNLRRKIEPDRASPTRIVTIFGVGYKFVPRDSGP